MMNTPIPNTHYPRILSIAGSDSGGCAGIQADLKTCSALGCFGMTAITAITAQNTVGVHAIQALEPKIVAAQIDAVVSDIGADAVKIGMLHSPEIVRAVVQALQQHSLKNIVLDPVMASSSGDHLMLKETIDVMVGELFPLVCVVTPNLDEASILLGRTIDHLEQLEQAAYDISSLGARSVLLKGGHLSEQTAGAQVTDLLLYRSESETWQTQSYSSPRIASINTHGTGCTLSSAIACYLALGLHLPEAVKHARAYITQAIEQGRMARMGQGHGPLNHGFAPLVMSLLD